MFVLLAAPLAAQPEFPELTGRVVDNAEILPENLETDLTAQLEALEQSTQRQLVVATVPDLQGYDIADYGYQLGRAWELGDAQRNDGMLLLVAPNERRVRIEVGYGLEGIMTDAFSQRIIDKDIIPYFRDGDMPAGIVAGTNALVSHLELPEEEALKVLEEQKSGGRMGLLIVPLILFSPGLFIFGIFLLAKISGSDRTSRYTGATGGSSVSVYSPSSSSSSSWSSSSSSSSFSSSSFSGGGGSFGGGGASGGW